MTLSFSKAPVLHTNAAIHWQFGAHSSAEVQCAFFHKKVLSADLSLLSRPAPSGMFPIAQQT
jgi:hypothetical protein